MSRRRFRLLLALSLIAAMVPLSVAPATGQTSPSVVINEVDADQTGTDSAEFVELFDGGAGNTALDGLVLVLYNGSDDASYLAFDLDGRPAARIRFLNEVA